MPSTALFAEIAALAGEPARAAMLHALMDGRALTATELAAVAGVTPQTASGHLARMTVTGLLARDQQGRHRYFRLASPLVARMLESIMTVAATLERPRRDRAPGPRDAALRRARTCYDHLAGRLGVGLCDALVAGGHVDLGPDAAAVTPSGLKLLAALGLDVAALAGPGRGRRILCRPCLDWSERRAHLGGALGAALCTHGLDEGWITRTPGSRAVVVTRKGERVFRDALGLNPAGA